MLDATVAPGVSALGIRARSRTRQWRPLSSYSLVGKVCIVTGATTGIGNCVATQLSALGATVVIVGRDGERTNAAARAIDAAATTLAATYDAGV